VEGNLDRRRLATALKDLRIRSGLSGQALGRVLGWTQTRVSRTENDRRRITAEEVTRWADATGASADVRAELAALAEGAAREVRSWWDVHAGGMTRRQLEIADLEAHAERICNFQPVVPGLLQTADYARRVLALADVTGQGDIPAAVAARMHRQAVLYDTAKQFDYVLTEAALRWRPADDPAVTRAQADRLLSVATLPNVSIAVLPSAAAMFVLPTSGFVIYEIPDEPLVLLETLTDELLFGGERELAAYREAFARLREASVTGDDAWALISAAMSTSR